VQERPAKARIFSEFQQGNAGQHLGCFVDFLAGLLGYHVYYLTGYNAANQTVTLVNPYWNDGRKTETVTLTELEEHFQGCAVVTPN
jgi:hypothetical protein